ncbi:MAG: hypothetical protein AAF529_16565 [Pseudomonadota bacterium]
MPFVKVEEEKPIDAATLEDTPFSAMTTAGVSRLLDNIIGLPNAAIRAKNDATETISAGLADAVGQGPSDALLGAADWIGATPVDMLFSSEPSSQIETTGLDILAGGDALLSMVANGSTDFDSAFQREKAAREELMARNPMAAALGGFGGDAATIASGRAPMVNGPGGLFDDAISATLTKGSTNLAATAATKGFKRQVSELLDNDIVRDMSRGIGRAAETGIEGAVLAAMQEGDPVETAAISAGMQLASSAGLTTAGAFLDHIPGQVLNEKAGPISKASMGMLGYAAVLTALQSAIGQAEPGQALEDSFDKITGGLALGLLAIPGKRSKEDGVLKNFPVLADSILTVPRTAMLELAQEIADKPSPQAESLINLMQSNPDALTEVQQMQIQEAIENGTFTDLAKKLAKDRELGLPRGQFIKVSP